MHPTPHATKRRDTAHYSISNPGRLHKCSGGVVEIDHEDHPLQNGRTKEIKRAVRPSHVSECISPSNGAKCAASSIAQAIRSEKGPSSSGQGSSAVRIRGGRTNTTGASGTWPSSHGRIPGRSLTTTRQSQASASTTTRGNPSKKDGSTKMSAF